MNLFDDIEARIRAINDHTDAIAEASARKELPGEIAIASTADKVCARLKKLFSDFEETLSPNEEIGMNLVSFGSTQQISVASVIAMGPNILVIKGFLGETPVTLAQHLNQLSFLLVPVKIQAPQAERRKIGFGAME